MRAARAFEHQRVHRRAKLAPVPDFAEQAHDAHLRVVPPLFPQTHEVKLDRGRVRERRRAVRRNQNVHALAVRRRGHCGSHRLAHLAHHVTHLPPERLAAHLLLHEGVLLPREQLVDRAAVVRHEHTVDHRRRAVAAPFRARLVRAVVRPEHRAVRVRQRVRPDAQARGVGGVERRRFIASPPPRVILLRRRPRSFVRLRVCEHGRSGRKISASVIHENVLAERIAFAQNAVLAPDEALLHDVERVHGRVLLENRLKRRRDNQSDVQREMQLERVVDFPLDAQAVDAVEVVDTAQPVAMQLLYHLALHFPRRVLHDVPPRVAAHAVLEDVVRAEALAQPRVSRRQALLEKKSVQRVHRLVEPLVFLVHRRHRRDHASDEVRVDETRR